MELNRRFQIALQYKSLGGQPMPVAIDASEFFDAEFVSECSPEQWGCNMPWELLEMDDYVPLPEEQRKAVEWIRLDIIDSKGPTHRRLVEQRWHGDRLLSDWENVLIERSPSQLILDLAGTSPDSRQIMKLSLSPHAVQVVQHVFLLGEEWDWSASDFKLPAFPGPFDAGDAHPDS